MIRSLMSFAQRPAVSLALRTAGRRWLWAHRAAATILLGGALAGCLAQAQFVEPASTPAGPPAALTTDRRLLFPASPDVQLATGDLVQVHVFEQADYTPSVRVSVEGDVLLPLIGPVHVTGLSIASAGQLIATKLKDAGIYLDPQVTVQLVEGPSAVATVSGEAHGVVPIVGSRRLLDVLAVAGGLPATASHAITIARAGAAQPIVVDLGNNPLHSDLANVPIFPGDTIIVSRIGVVYVVGAFKQQGAIPLTQYSPLTLTQAASLSGGISYQGKFNDLHLIRTVGDKRTVVKLDIQRILYGKDPDPILQANDIVFLPDSALKASIGNGSIPTLLGVVSLLISVTR